MSRNHLRGSALFRGHSRPHFRPSPPSSASSEPEAPAGHEPSPEIPFRGREPPLFERVSRLAAGQKLRSFGPAKPGAPSACRTVMFAWLAGPKDAPAIPLSTGTRQSLAIFDEGGLGWRYLLSKVC